VLYIYIISVVFFGLSFDQSKIVNSRAGCKPDVGILPLLFDLSNIISTFGILAMLVAGFIIGQWWWVLIALICTWIVITFSRSINPALGFIPTILGAIIGVASSVFLFVN